MKHDSEEKMYNTRYMREKSNITKVSVIWASFLWIVPEKHSTVWDLNRACIYTRRVDTNTIFTVSDSKCCHVKVHASDRSTFSGRWQLRISIRINPD